MNTQLSLYIVLFVAFLDWMGLGLVYPLFSPLLFDVSKELLPLETSQEVRGILLGLLIALMPLAQFFAAPIWGAISDGKGRKKPLQISLVIALFGYSLSLWGIMAKQIGWLLISRLVVGVAAGNNSIVQATIVDLSTPQSKVKNFGLYGMAGGVGFTLGPFFGGLLASWGDEVPFIFAAVLVFLNLIFALFFLQETLSMRSVKLWSWTACFNNLFKAFELKEIRTLLCASFVHNFAWSYFFEFIPVYLIAQFAFSSYDLGLFFGAAGAFYAFSTGVLIRPMIYWFQPETLFCTGNIIGAMLMLMMLFLPGYFWIWPLLFFLIYFVSFISPTCTAMISNNSPSATQGESLGVLNSVNAAAFVLSPLVSGSLVGTYPALPILVGSVVMFLAGCISYFITARAHPPLGDKVQ